MRDYFVNWCFYNSETKKLGFRFDLCLLETIPVIVKIQYADHRMWKLLCERVFAPLLYHNRQCFIFYSRYHLWGLSGLNSSPNLLFSSHAPLGNIMNQWQTAQSTDSDTCDGCTGHRNPLVVTFWSEPQLVRLQQVFSVSCQRQDTCYPHTHTLIL